MKRSPLKRSQILKKTPLKRTGRTAIAKAKIKAWQAFSLYIRLDKADKYGFVKCITCQAKKNYKEMQAGHFLPGRNNAVLFSEEGVHPQCYSCNVGKHGNWPAYYDYMKEMYGLDVVEELMKERHTVVKYTLTDYQEIEKFYKTKYEKLL